MATVVDAVVGKCIEMLGDLAKEEFLMMLGVKAELEKLQKKMVRLSDYLEDAKNKSWEDKSIRSWLGQLKDIVYDADDIIDLCKVKGTELLGDHTPRTTTASVCCYYPFISCFTCIKFRHEIGKKIQELNNRLEDLAKNDTMLPKLESKKPVPSIHKIDYRKTSPVKPESDIVGEDIKKATDDLVKLLVEKNDGKKSSVFGIVGMGGIGKTTLAGKVFNHASIVDHFPFCVWLCVSQTFDGTDLLKQVIRKVGGQYEEATSKDELDKKLASLLTKKLFLVLDDVWESNVWEDFLRSPLECGAASVQVLITTRDEAVARAMQASNIHNVGNMNDCDGWALLCKHVFRDCDGKEMLDLKDIGMEVVKRCHGLPLAIRAIAGVLRSKKRTINDWEMVLQSSAWSITKLPEELRGSLYLSYEDLQSELKQCFLFCSLYPEDHTIDRDELIRFWVAEGFIRADGDTIMEDLAEDYYSQLIDRSLLQPVEIQSCNMHDLLRSLAQFLIGEENICFDGKVSTPNTNTIRKLRRLSFVKTSESEKVPFEIKEKCSLRTMLFFEMPHLQILLENNNIFKFLSCLRVLDLKHTKIDSLPDSVGTLVHLRLLDLSYTEITRLPESMGTLVNLQTLNLNRCENLKTLPKDITRISSLRYLNVKRTGLRHMPKGFCQLNELNCLEGFLVGDDGICGVDGWTIGCNMGELENLSKLRRLSIHNLKWTSNGTPAVKNKSFLKLPSLGQLPQLKSLAIRGADAIVTVDSEFHTSKAEGAFPKLETLEFKEIENWEEWLLNGNEVGSEGRGAATKLLPRLTLLLLKKCPKLRSLPTGLGHATCLKELYISFCDSLIEVKNLPRLAGLTVDSCPGLQRISDLPLLAELLVINCGGLQRISDLPLLAELYVHECGGLQRIFDVPLLANLYVRECGCLQRICDLPLLAKLYVDECGGLQRISDLPLLAKLSVHHCGGLQRISDLPLLGNLNIPNYPQLTHVANLDALRNLNLRLNPLEEKCLPEWLDGLAAEQELKIRMHDTPPTTSTSTAMLQPPPLHLNILRCDPFLLRRCLKGGEDWHIIHKFPQVTITTLPSYGGESMMYTRTPPTYTTNLKTEKELEDIMAMWAPEVIIQDDDINKEVIMEDDDINEEA